ncbi:MAG: chemotaxis protein CheW [Zetaproteobacteria bacterium]|nr:chemotaxis protein CheW [Zetaproteobacteria bacterium]
MKGILEFDTDQYDADDSGIFAIRGSLDGENQEEYTEKVQCIGLKIREELFYLPISIVVEIVMLMPITYVPQSGRSIEGVMNLRGTILPVVNLRKLMGVEKGGATPSTRIIIAKSHNYVVGFLVDAITYVVSLHPSDFEQNSMTGRGQGSEFIGGIAKDGEQIIGVLDTLKIIQSVAASDIDIAQEKQA